MTDTTTREPLIRTGTCECGEPVTRTLPPEDRENHWAVKFFRNLPLVCDACANADTERLAAEETVRVEEDRQHRFAMRLAGSGLPAKYHTLELAALDHPAAILASCCEWATSGGGLLLTGEIGRGKTTLSGAAAVLALRQRSVVWTSAPLLMARLGSGLGSQQRDWALTVLQGKCALVLDDIDKARPTEYGAEQIFLAVDQRVEHDAPLLVTSNLSPGELAAKWPEPYGGSIASRIVGYCKVVEIAGMDRRLKGQKA